MRRHFCRETWLSLLVGLAAWGLSCRPSHDPPPPAPAPAVPLPRRIGGETWRARQLFMARSVLPPKYKVSPWQQSAQDLALGHDVSLKHLEPDYWRWQVAWYLWKVKGMDMRPWFEQWLRDEMASENIRSMFGSINHQVCRQGGRWVCAEMGILDPRFKSIEAFRAHQKEILLAILRGEGWVSPANPLAVDRGSGEKSEWGLCGEISASNHYLSRNWNQAVAIADLTSDPEIRTEMVRQLDIGAEEFRKKVDGDGFLRDCLGARFPARTHSDACLYREGSVCTCPDGRTYDCGCDDASELTAHPEWHVENVIATLRKYNLTRNPEDTWVIAYLFFGTPWHPEMQGRDWRIVQWTDYLYLGGRVWRPKIRQHEPSSVAPREAVD
jgi:hypothetical protein